MDNSATSFPKPPQVVRDTKKAITKYFANPGRGTFKDALKVSEAVYEAREVLSLLVGTLPENIIFTYNATYAMNIALQGILKENMTVVTDKFAHNSVLRPLYALQKNKVNLKFIDTHPLYDSVMISSFEEIASKEKADVLVLTHTSNVTGKKTPLKQMSAICKKHGILLVVDASQGLGSCDIDMKKLGIDVLVSSGHKGLYGIMGIGFLAIGDGSNILVDPLITGGSGIFSHRKTMPEALPERLEAGTLGVPGIISLRSGAEYVMKVGAEEIGYREKLLRTRLVEGLSDISGVRVYNEDVNANSIVLFNFEKLCSEIGAERMEKEGIALRAGFHCAPLIHSMIGKGRRDYDGALRLSVGYFNTKRECEKVIRAVSYISKNI